MHFLGQALLQSQALMKDIYGTGLLAFFDLTIWISSFAFTLALVCVYWIVQQPRGPRRLPLLGSTIEVMRTLDYHHDWSTEYAKRFKTFDVYVLRLRRIYTADPAVLEYFLKTNFSNYIKGPIMYEVQEDFLGRGIFNTDGDKWRQQRKMFSLEFSPRILRDINFEAFRKYAVRLTSILLDEARIESVVDVQEFLKRMSMDSTAEVAFGAEFNSLSASLPDIPFASAFDRANAISFVRHFDYLWKLKRALNIGSEAEMKQNIALLDQFTYDIIETKRRELDRCNERTKRRDLLARLIDLGKDNPDIFTDKVLRDMALNFFLASRDGTATTLSWFLLTISQHPEVQFKILEELNAVLENEDLWSQSLTVEKLAQMLTFEAVGKLHYLQSALSETLRLYPAVPEDSKVALADDVLPDGTRVRAGDAIVHLPYAMGRMEQLWGKDVLEFKPERWLKDGVFVPESPFKFSAFQAGPRACLGKDSSFLQMKITAALLTRFLEMELEGDVKEVRYEIALTFFFKSGLRMRVRSRQKKPTLA